MSINIHYTNLNRDNVTMKRLIILFKYRNILNYCINIYQIFYKIKNNITSNS
jgi:hypothetical protein